MELVILNLVWISLSDFFLILSLSLIDDDLVSHEFHVSNSIALGLNGRNLSAFLVNEDLQSILKFLLQVEILQVVNNGNMVDVATWFREESVSGLVKWLKY